MNKTIYFDYQATTPVDSDVLKEMLPYFGHLFGNPHSNDHIVGWRAAQAIEESLHHVAHLIGADADEIVLTSGATEANNLALLGVGRKAIEGSRKRVLVSAIEHKCVLESSRKLQEQLGYSIETIPVDREGYVDLCYLEQALSDNVLLVSIMLVNNEIGTIQNLIAISNLVHKYGALLHSDAAQAPSAMSISNVTEHLDLLSLSGHKMYGPQGIGALYVRRDIQSALEPILYGGEQQTNLRSGTLPLPLCVGLGAAARRISQAGSKELKLVQSQTMMFINELSKIPYRTELNGPSSFINRHPGNANIKFIGFDAKEILGALQPQVAASTGSACTTGIPEESHVLKAIGLLSDQSKSSIRFSLGKDTTYEDVKTATRLIGRVLNSSVFPK